MWSFEVDTYISNMYLYVVMYVQYQLHIGGSAGLMIMTVRVQLVV